ncbi:hypothetical protein HDU84_007738 [Entophlyctis sp. JEL0112]|nr:hypothetical protein HDU84_007738 [Entophlyctis sp. JEL0112]
MGDLSITLHKPGLLTVLVFVAALPAPVFSDEVIATLDSFVNAGSTVFIRLSPILSASAVTAALPQRFHSFLLHDRSQGGFLGASFAVGVCSPRRQEDIADFVTLCHNARIPLCVPGCTVLSDFSMTSNDCRVRDDTCADDIESASTVISSTSSFESDESVFSETTASQTLDMSSFVLQPPKSAKFCDTSFIPPPLSQSLDFPYTLSIVGAGPGTPELLTVSAITAIQKCSLLIVDRLVPSCLVEYALTVRIDSQSNISKILTSRSMPYILHTRKVLGNAPQAQKEIEEWTAEALKLGHHVVRLKGGDPFVYGRGGEEYLAASKVTICKHITDSRQQSPTQKENALCTIECFAQVSVIPGLSSSLVSPLVANIPSTHRGVADQVLIATGRLEDEEREIEWPLYSPTRTTVVLMAMGRINRVVNGMINDAGYPSLAPAALVEKAGWGMDQGQRIWKGRLCEVESAVRDLGLKAHCTLIIGDVLLDNFAFLFQEFHGRAAQRRCPVSLQLLPTPGLVVAVHGLSYCDPCDRWFHATDAPKYDHSPFKLPAPQPPIDLTAPVIAIQTAAGIITSTNPVVSKAKAPTSWTAFSVRDSAKIEDVYQGLLSAAATGQQQPSPLVLVNEDYLHEVDVAKCEIYPVYWYGPTYHVQRGTWFVSPDNGAKFIPCDDNLAKQLEEGYKKFKPWLQQSTPTLPVSSEKGASLTSTTGSIPALQPDNKGVPAAYKPDQKWALFGPYMNSYVIYNEKRSALIISDQLSSKLARAVMSQISRNTDTQAWGTRVWRGWDEVEKLLKKNASTAKKRVSTGSMDPPSLPLGGEVSSSAPDISTISAVLGVAPTSASNSISDIQNDASPGVPTKISRESLLGDDWKDDENAVQDRHIDHLVLVVHGVGQKMGERLENVDFAKDCTTMRQAIKECSKLYFSSSSSSPSNAKSNSRKPVLPNMADHGGVQVLPVQWRHKLEFGKRKENKNETDTTQKELEAEVAKLQEREVHVDDITLEGVASIRYLVSDIVLDVLLYMTPRYRQEMVNHVVDEMNRIYRAYMQRNPNFKGKVSIYGHSLGSVLAFDILCNQPFGKTTGVRTPASLNLPQRLQSEMDLSDVIGSLNSDLSSRRLNGLMERSEIEYKCLEFEVDKFFAVGSPVALFLLLKGDKLQGRGHPEAKQIDAGIARPACNAVYNVFHPHDPVAYRFEPLACKMMAKEKPVPIQYNKGGLKGTITGISDFGSGIVSRGYNMFSGLFVSPSIIAGNTQASGTVHNLANIY